MEQSHVIGIYYWDHRLMSYVSALRLYRTQFDSIYLRNELSEDVDGLLEVDCVPKGHEDTKKHVDDSQ